jgi:hypothetical protein
MAIENLMNPYGSGSFTVIAAIQATLEGAWDRIYSEREGVAIGFQARGTDCRVSTRAGYPVQLDSFDVRQGDRVDLSAGFMIVPHR